MILQLYAPSTGSCPPLRLLSHSQSLICQLISHTPGRQQSRPVVQRHRARFQGKSGASESYLTGERKPISQKPILQPQRLGSSLHTLSEPDQRRASSFLPGARAARPWDQVVVMLWTLQWAVLRQNAEKTERVGTPGLVSCHPEAGSFTFTCPEQPSLSYGLQRRSNLQIHH